MNVSQPRKKRINYIIKCIRRISQEALAEYQEARKKEKKTHRRKKREYENHRIEELEELRSRNEIIMFYGDLNKNRRDYKPRLTLSRNENAELISDKPNILHRWKRHFDDLLGGEMTQQDGMEGDTHRCKDTDNYDSIEDEPPTLEEVQIAMVKLTNGKAPGADNLRAELIKQEGECLKQLHE